MLLYRRHYLALADVNQQAFRSLARRNQVPRLPGDKPEWPAPQPSNLRADEEVDTFGYYPVEAIMLGIADALVTQTSTSRDAAKLSVEAWPQFAMEATRRVEHGEVIFACFFTMSGKVGRVIGGEDDSLEKVPSFLCVGTFDEVTERLKTVASNRSKPLGSATLLNLTPLISRASHLFDQLTDGQSLSKAMEN
ncbi:MAG: hypothetical protein DI528_13000 [Shinella sp.]|nr:MAG: hypothetical protein DI528_13000 [Shinella sp.]